MPKKVLVTGGAGFIGSFTVDELLRGGHKVKIFDNLDTQVHNQGKVPRYLNPEAEFVKGDIRDYDALKQALTGVEIIFHLAASVGVGQSQYQIKKYVDVNIGGTANLLDIIVNVPNRVEKIIVAGSMSSYGEGLCNCPKCGSVKPPLRSEEEIKKGNWEHKCTACRSILTPTMTPETVSLDCNSIYAITKRVQEEMVLNIGKAYKIAAISLRYFNVYGPRQSLSNPYTGVCAIFMSRLKNNRPPVIYEDGRQSRDFISVYDVVYANILAMEGDGLSGDAFNVGTGQATTILEIAQLLAKLYKKDIEPQITSKFRKGDIRHCIADIEKIKRKADFIPKVSFGDGMKELVEWSRMVEAKDYFVQAEDELDKRGLV